MKAHEGVVAPCSLAGHVRHAQCLSVTCEAESPDEEERKQDHLNLEEHIW